LYPTWDERGESLLNLDGANTAGRLWRALPIPESRRRTSLKPSNTLVAGTELIVIGLWREIGTALELAIDGFSFCMTSDGAALVFRVSRSESHFHAAVGSDLLM